MRKKLTAGMLLVLSPCFGWDVGFDFRATPSFVTDPSYALFAALGATAYPTTATVNGQTVTYGWESVSASSLTRDRTTSVDPRLAGINCQYNDGHTSVFRVDLPSVGDYNIGLAVGDSANNSQRTYLTVSSGSSPVLSLVSYTGINPALDVADATGTVMSPSVWTGTNSAVRKTFGSRTLRMTLGGTADSVFSCVAHLRITTANAIAPRVGGWSFFVL